MASIILYFEDLRLGLIEAITITIVPIIKELTNKEGER